MKPSPIRQHIRAVLDSLPGVADTEALAAAVIARMSEQERYDALLTLLPQLVRDEDRRRAQARSLEAVDPDTAWTVATEHRVRPGGEDKFFSDASAAEVEEMAVARRRAGQNIAGPAARSVVMAEAMRSSGAETVAGLQPEVGLLAVLRQDLRTARRRVANRTALEQLAATTDELTESPGLAVAGQLRSAGPGSTCRSDGVGSTPTAGADAAAGGTRPRCTPRGRGTGPPVRWRSRVA